MVATDPAAVAQKWATRLSGATTEITAGVNAVTVAPGQLAAKQADVWLAKLQASKAKWVNNVSRVSLDEWKNKMLTVGVQRIAGGAQANQHKVQDFFGEFLPFVHANAAKVRAMPKGDLGSSIARASKMIQLNAQFVRGKGSGQQAN